MFLRIMPWTHNWFVISTAYVCSVCASLECSIKYVLYVLQYFDGVDMCNQTNSVTNHFKYPVIAQYIRLVPLKWIEPFACLKLELHGCLIKGT